MYVDGYLLFAIYFIAVLALAVSAYALWSLEEIRQYYERRNDRQTNTRPRAKMPARKQSTAKGYFDNIY
jgi:CHASE3 domain sensor protein